MTPSLNSMKDWGTRKGYDFVRMKKNYSQTLMLN